MEFLTKLLGIATAVAETTTTGAADPAAVTTDSAVGGIFTVLGTLFPLLLVFVLMYFMMIRPEKKRRKKDEENNADPQFFLNRLVPVFPELRDEMNEERIVYGQVRTALFAAEKVAPKCENLAKNYKDSEPMKRMCTIFCDMYAAGDMDTRAVIQFGVLNNIKDEAAIRNIIANFTDGCDLQKVYKHSRKLIGKNIKPEKEKKKGKKVEARLSN